MSTFISRSSPYAASQKVAATPKGNDETIYFGFSATTWVKLGLLSLLFIMLFWPNLRRLWEKTNPISGEDNWKHGAFVPLIGLYYLYVNRDQLLAATVKPAWSGLLITLGGILFFGYGIWPGQNDWFKDVGMVVTLFGLVTLMCGWGVMKTAWFPIVFLICALPWPGLFYSMLAGPLQKLAASVAVRTLNFFGVASSQFGTKIFIEGANHVVRTLNVAEACAGLRSLMSFIAIAGAVAFLSFRPLWQKIIMVFSAIPIAIFCNTLRITVQGLFDAYLSHQWSESFAHGFLGLAMMIPAFFLILLVGWVLQNILIEEADKRSLRPMTSNAASGVRRAPVGASRVSTVGRGVESPVRGAAAPAGARTSPTSAGNSPSAAGQRVAAAKTPGSSATKPAAAAGTNANAKQPSTAPVKPAANGNGSTAAVPRPSAQAAPSNPPQNPPARVKAAPSAAPATKPANTSVQQERP